MGNLRIFGASNEKYHVRGGNDQITAAMASALRARSRSARELTAIRRNGDGSWTLSFRRARHDRDGGSGRDGPPVLDPA